PAGRTAAGPLPAPPRLLINGPPNARPSALLSPPAVVPAEERVAAAVLLAFLVGVVQVGIALLRLGDLTRYVSHSVIVGFTLGAATLLVMDQAGNLLRWQNGYIDTATLLIGVGTIAIVVVVRRGNDVMRKWGWRFFVPQHLLAIVLMTWLVATFRLHEVYDVKVPEEPVRAALPSFAWPELHWERVRLLAGNAFAIAVLGLLEAVAMAKAIAARTGQRLDINQQCFSEGAANLAGSFFQCIPGSGSLTRSAVNQQAGAVSQWSGVFAAAGVAATVLLFAPLAEFIPRASLARFLMLPPLPLSHLPLAALRVVGGRQLAFHPRATRWDARIVVATALAAVLISVEFCIVIGVFVSFVLYVPRAAQVRLVLLAQTRDGHLRERLAGDPPC